MGRSRYRITQIDQPHFLTLTVLHWIPVFTRPDTVDLLLNSFRFLQKEDLKVFGWVILENHLHLVAQSADLQRDMARFKSFTSRQLLDYLRRKNAHQILQQLAFYKKAHKTDRALQFWQEGMHPELIQSDAMMQQKLDYIHQNPVKRGYVDYAEQWRYSSARDYLGQPGLLEVCKLW